MTKGIFGSKLTKNSGNYIGKVKAGSDGSSVTIYGKVTDGGVKVEYGYLEYPRRNYLSNPFSSTKVPRVMMLALPNTLNGKAVVDHH